MTQNDFPQQEYQTILAAGFEPGFFSKLASYGIHPQTPEDCQKLLLQAEYLRQGEEAGAIKQSSAPVSDLIDETTQGLHQVLASRGVLPGQAAHDDYQAKQACAALAQDPAVQEAALRYGQYLVSLQEAAAGS
jgi:hypothetical protein